MKEKIEQIKTNSIMEIEKAETQKELADAKVKYLGKKGELTLVLREMGKLTQEERPIMGKLVNEVRDILEEEFSKKEKELKYRELQKRIETENIDVTEPGKKIELGSIHPITKIIKEVEEIFLGMGYQIADGPEVEKTFYNFDQLNAPVDHPSRDLQDTFYRKIAEGIFEAAKKSLEEKSLCV